MYYVVRYFNKYIHDHFDFSFYDGRVDRNATLNNGCINFCEMSNSCNGEAVENTVVDNEGQEGLCAKAISKDPCAGTASGAMGGESMTTSLSSELESTMDSMSKEIAKNLAEHYTELTQYAVVMSEIIDTLNKAALQSEACQDQKMVEECYKTETHEPLNCLGPVQQFVQCMRDYTQTVVDTLKDDEEAHDYIDDDDGSL